MGPFATEILTVAYITIEWAIRISMLVTVPFRRTPEAARSWLLLVMFLPIPAAILYFFIGRAQFPNWRRKRFQQLEKLLRSMEGPGAKMDEHTNVLPQTISDIAELVQRLGNFPAAAGNDVTLFNNYHTILDQLVLDIDNAKVDIHILVYIFADDEVGQRISDALTRAAARGVVCRILADAVGSHWWSIKNLRTLKKNGIIARTILPLGSKMARADLRNHRKIAVIDGEVGYIGSQNIIGCESAPDFHNQELVSRVRGTVVRQMQSIFIMDWFLETEEFIGAEERVGVPHSKFVPHGEAVAQILPTGPDYSNAALERLYVALIHRANSTVIIASPYFIPSDSLLQALYIAVQRGVSVQLLFSERTDNYIVGLAQRSYYEDLLREGVVIRHYAKNFLHAKYVISDDNIALVGSGNLDIRSFLLNAEAALIVYSAKMVSELQKLHLTYIEQAETLNAGLWASRSKLSKIGENLARLISPLL